MIILVKILRECFYSMLWIYRTISVSMIEKLASRKGENTINVVDSKSLELPEIDADGLEGVFTGWTSDRHSIALGELDNFNFEPELPRKSALLGSNLASRPKRKCRKSRSNPIKTAHRGQTSYTETRTNVTEIMSAKLSKHALAGLAAKEDVKNVRLRPASRNRDEELLPYRHPLLIKFKGRQRVYARVVTCSKESLNHEDSFVLITADEVYLYMPKLSNVIEKSKAKDFAQLICQSGDLGTAAKTPRPAESAEAFWAAMGGRIPPLTNITHNPDNSDKEFETTHIDSDRCWTLVTEGNRHRLVPEMQAWSSIPSQSLLQFDKIFVFEFGMEVYIWMGSQSALPLRRVAQKLARQLLSKYPRTDGDIFGKITQNRETALFIEKFADWTRANRETFMLPMRHRSSSYEAPKLDKIQFADPTESNRRVEIMSGKYNVAGGAGDITDEDGRIMNISTSNYSIKEVKSGKLVDCDSDKTVLRETDVVVVIWEFQISGTGRWKGKESKSKIKSKSQGAKRQIVFLWSGSIANELDRGEAALLVTELKLGTVSPPKIHLKFLKYIFRFSTSRRGGNRMRLSKRGMENCSFKPLKTHVYDYLLSVAPQRTQDISKKSYE